MQIPLPSPAPSGDRPDAPAKQRILATADVLFTREGIRAVGVDRLIEESHVTKATFYKHFRAKDRLVLAYLTNRHRRIAAELAALLAPIDDAREALDAFREWTVAGVGDPLQRGCAFLAAAIEHPEPEHPVRLSVAAHRAWLLSVLEHLLREAGVPGAEEAAVDLLLTRDGALLGGFASDPAAAADGLRRAFRYRLAEPAIAA